MGHLGRSGCIGRNGPMRLILAPCLVALIWPSAAPLGGAEPVAAAPTPSPISDPLSFVADYLCCRPAYCKKPLPCQWCIFPGTCPDCYFAKPLPVVCLGCVPSTCDDYCSKPLPRCLPGPLCSGGCCRQTGGMDTVNGASWLPGFSWLSARPGSTSPQAASPQAAAVPRSTSEGSTRTK